MTVLVTGANGFIGSRVRILAAKRGIAVRNAVRNTSAGKDMNSVKGELEPDFDWSGALEGISTVVHLAARVHLEKDAAEDPLGEYRRINTQGTINLAGQAAGGGVKRFVFISSIGVNGRLSTRPFTEKDPPNPANPYAQSKFEAEAELLRIAANTGMEIVIIRPPLVYGPKAPGNFGRLVRLVQTGLPLPFALIKNKRSLVAIDNLADLIITCIDHPAAAGQTFLLSDGVDLSTPELIQKLAMAMGSRARLFPVPPALLWLGGQITRKTGEIERLTSSLQVDISHTCETLCWRPPVEIDEGLRKCVALRTSDPGTGLHESGEPGQR